VIFETDHRSIEPTLVGVAVISGNLGQTFNILKDPSSWKQPETPRVVNSTDKSKIVFSFDGEKKAVATVSAWNSSVTELEIVISGTEESQVGQAQIKYWNEIVSMLQKRLNTPPIVVASSPGKVNIYFAVGAFLKDGFHDVASCYQALSLRERVLVELTGNFSIDFAGPFEQESALLVPKDSTNLVYMAGEQLKALGSAMGSEKVSFLIHKSVPIAGGMAGGSADAAASLVALNSLFGAELDEKLPEAAAALGSDVPFSLMGGTAVGVGRGEVLTKVQDGPALHWVMTPNPAGLSTPQVYRQLDVMRVNQGIDVSALEAPEVPEELLEAIATGDVATVAKLMHNDLEIAAVAMLPELAETLEAGRKAGSLRSMVSGSGPTIAHLAKSAVHAEQIATRLKAAGYPSLVTYTSNSGTRLEN
jgi:4-diphosphocytidyl-2-C-methyl-D-erythritol kinase